jgi:hypothetical protein
MPPDSVRRRGYDYLISAGYKRFDVNPVKHSENIKNYRENFKNYKTVKLFDPGLKYRGNEIRVLKVD